MIILLRAKNEISKGPDPTFNMGQGIMAKDNDRLKAQSGSKPENLLLQASDHSFSDVTVECVEAIIHNLPIKPPADESKFTFKDFLYIQEIRKSYKNTSKYLITHLLALTCMLFTPYLYAYQSVEQDSLFNLSLEEIMQIKVEVDVASLFQEEDLLVGSSVSLIDSEKWKRLGAWRMVEALNNETSVASYTTAGGACLTFIRGYSKKTSLFQNQKNEHIPNQSFLIVRW